MTIHSREIQGGWLKPKKKQEASSGGMNIEVVGRSRSYVKGCAHSAGHRKILRIALRSPCTTKSRHKEKNLPSKTVVMDLYWSQPTMWTRSISQWRPIGCTELHFFSHCSDNHHQPKLMQLYLNHSIGGWIPTEWSQIEIHFQGHFVELGIQTRRVSEYSRCFTPKQMGSSKRKNQWMNMYLRLSRRTTKKWLVPMAPRLCSPLTIRWNATLGMTPIEALWGLVWWAGLWIILANSKSRSRWKSSQAPSTGWLGLAATASYSQWLHHLSPLLPVTLVIWTGQDATSTYLHCQHPLSMCNSATTSKLP